MHRSFAIAVVCFSASVSAGLAMASDVSAIVTISDKPDTYAIEVAGGSPPKFDVPRSEVGITLLQLSVPKGSAVFLRILGPLTKKQLADLRKQIEDAGYVLATVKVGFLTESQK